MRQDTQLEMQRSDADVRCRIGADERASEVVVTAVARATGKATTTVGTGDPLAPLYETLDPEALDALVESGDGPDTRVTFGYGGCDVTVDATGVVAVRER